jgi:hypothetical protein
MSENFESKNKISSHLPVWAMIATFVFLVVCIFGEGLGGSLGSNPSCYKYLGCTDGFGGYDAIEHFLFGIAAVWILISTFQKFPKYSLFQTEHWKNVLTIIALVVLISVAWEFLECAHDAFRVDILHQTLVNWKLHLNLLNQPTNLDTMGDLFFASLGSTIALFFTKF